RRACWRTAACACWAAWTTWSRPAASASRPARSRPRCTGTPPSRRAPWWASPTPSAAKPWWPTSSPRRATSRAPRWQTRCASTPRGTSRRTWRRARSASWTSFPPRSTGSSSAAACGAAEPAHVGGHLLPVEGAALLAEVPEVAQAVEDAALEPLLREAREERLDRGGGRVAVVRDAQRQRRHPQPGVVRLALDEAAPPAPRGPLPRDARGHVLAQARPPGHAPQRRREERDAHVPHAPQTISRRAPPVAPMPVLARHEHEALQRRGLRAEPREPAARAVAQHHERAARKRVAGRGDGGGHVQPRPVAHRRGVVAHAREARAADAAEVVGERGHALGGHGRGKGRVVGAAHGHRGAHEERGARPSAAWRRRSTPGTGGTGAATSWPLRALTRPGRSRPGAGALPPKRPLPVARPGGTTR